MNIALLTAGFLLVGISLSLEIFERHVHGNGNLVNAVIGTIGLICIFAGM